jgi:hypothetical protein
MVSHWYPTIGCPGSSSDHIMWDLRWTNWQWGRFSLYQADSVSPHQKTLKQQCGVPHIIAITNHKAVLPSGTTFSLHHWNPCLECPRANTQHDANHENRRSNGYICVSLEGLVAHCHQKLVAVAATVNQGRGDNIWIKTSLQNLTEGNVLPYLLGFRPMNHHHHTLLSPIQLNLAVSPACAV